MNSFGKLTWDFTPIKKEVAFMDLTLRVTPQGIQSRLFEKPLNLYLYIPPHLAHAPGFLKGLVFGMTERIFRLTSHWQDKQSTLKNLFLRLCNRGYTSSILCPLFEIALT
jgi:peptide-methionine (R)-S-oxide reductase